ncbi:MAG: PEP-CTERM sorting domain-containing protein [Novosphingobium sp.]|uniref:PEP-CTERM sorting domain-containing protein n=1 Tax=Tsuneonella sp. CC-YZS046 TaxID=3042152 RepID=UPI002D77F06F|nr:PEP-CTERM sorting domain-containing protein [Tsuneonella sp. CC-YZS046]WRO67165.1 PEP-CTERM sorting domain-containing protein [Tsuneonella sp. CC-YZS046]
MYRLALFLLMSVHLLLAAPVNASSGTTVPEPSDLALFILGLLGVILGREVAIRYKRRDKDHDNKL